MTDPEQLHRYQVLLFKADAEFLVKHFGYGWSAMIRQWVHAEAEKLRPKRKQTLGDLFDE